MSDAIAKYFRSYYADIEYGYDPADNGRKCYEVAIGEMRKRLESFRCEQIGPHKLYLGDCRELLPLLGQFDAVVTDPPYGIGVDRQMAKVSGTKYGRAAAAKSTYQATGWDDAAPDGGLLNLIRASAVHQVIFGGNYFDLPPSRCWLVWDKENGANAFADCELAWTNIDKPVRRLDWMWNGMLRKGGEPRGEHPTQKPIGVMKWCIEQLPEPSKRILDPFMGSGTTGVAAAKLGRTFTGIEREERYFEIACRRVTAAMNQPDMFVTAPKPEAEQLALLESF